MLSLPLGFLSRVLAGVGDKWRTGSEAGTAGGRKTSQPEMCGYSAHSQACSASDVQATNWSRLDCTCNACRLSPSDIKLKAVNLLDERLLLFVEGSGDGSKCKVYKHTIPNGKPIGELAGGIAGPHVSPGSFRQTSTAAATASLSWSARDCSGKC